MTDAEFLAECERRGVLCLRKWTEPSEHGFYIRHEKRYPGVDQGPEFRLIRWPREAAVVGPDCSYFGPIKEG